MNESDLLSVKIASSVASRYIGPDCYVKPVVYTGDTGNIGNTGYTGDKGQAGFIKSFTILVNFRTTTSISKIYIPPGLFSTNAEPGLSDGGEFTSNQGGDLLFQGVNNITLTNTTYPFISGMFVSGYISGGSWIPVPGANMDNNGRVGYSMTSDFGATINLPLGFINGGNLISARSGFGSGYLVAIFLVYA